jgi:hypothetical protein
MGNRAGTAGPGRGSPGSVEASDGRRGRTPTLRAIAGALWSQASLTSGRRPSLASGGRPSLASGCCRCRIGMLSLQNEGRAGQGGDGSVESGGRRAGELTAPPLAICSGGEGSREEHTASSIPGKYGGQTLRIG